MEKAIALDPNNYLAYEVLGKAFMLNQKYDLAIEAIESALIRKPGNFRLHNKLGQLLVIRKDKNEALRHLIKSFELNPEQKGKEELVKLIKNLEATRQITN